MAYRALLFCPDEKAARIVTQVLGELEFTVEPCLEPFAAVKRLMGEHFDAVVVDCDNEQNATLLFKSARNSTSNQASLAVAVVEGQAGVAKAFRIGANLVLTKPINIEQSKGTLRVARGLLRRGEPAKPGAAAASASAAAGAKPVSPKPIAAARPAATTAVQTPRPAVPSAAKPAATPAPAAVASSAPTAPNENLLEISASAPSTVAAAPPAFDHDAPAPPAPKLPVPTGQAPSIELTSGFKAAPSAIAFASGAASAPAPAREPQNSHVAAAPPASPAQTADLLENPAPAVVSEAHQSDSAATTFTFGGANVPAESEPGRKKILMGVAAVIVVAAALYFAWTYFEGRASEPSSQFATPTSSTPAPLTAASPIARPAGTPLKPVPTAPTTSAPSPSTLLAGQSASGTATRSAVTTADAGLAPEDNDTTDSPSSAKPASTSGKAAASARPAGSPLLVKGGAAPAAHTKTTAASDFPVAPSMIGMAAPGTSAPPPNLVSNSATAPKPVLQTLNISQGVSQGLLIKKVQPQYPRNALSMHVEGAVELTATISTSGNISSVKVLSGEQLLTRAAVDAVKQWKYKPYLLNGEPVEIQTQITVNFKLPH